MRIFISHCWADKEFAAYKLMLHHLAEKGHDVWLDKENMAPGDNTYTRMNEGVNECELIVALVSPNYEKSKACMFEFETAQKLGKPVLPCRIVDKRLEGPLKDVLFIDLVPKANQLVDGFATLDHTLVNYAVRKSGNAELNQQSDKLQKLWNEIGDHNTRKEKGVSGNEASSVYISSGIKALQEVLAMNSNPGPEERQLSAFFSDVEQHVNKVYTQPWQEAVKNGLLALLIERHDPSGSNSSLQMFRQIVMGNTDVAVVRIAACIARAKENPHNDKAPEAFVKAIYFVPNLLNKVLYAGKQLGLQNELRFIFDTIAAYYENPNDLIPDAHGYYGLADDSFLALTYLYELNKLCLQKQGRALFDVSLDEQAMALRTVLTPQQVDVLRANVLQTTKEAEEALLVQQFAGAVLAGWMMQAAMEHGSDASHASPAGSQTLNDVRRNHAQNQADWAYLNISGQL